MYMRVNWGYVVGFATIAGVLGVSAYAVILHRKERREHDHSISVEEARSIVEETKHYSIPQDLSETLKPVMTEEDGSKLGDLINGVGASISYSDDVFIREHLADITSYGDMTTHSVMARPIKEVEEENEREDLEQMEEELREKTLEQEPILLEDEGEGKLRYDPNSDEALLQFMRMELAEWAPYEEIYKTLEFLYDVPFEPKVDGDIALHSTLVDYRGEFFGPASRWAINVPFTDMILHYARLADYNLGGGIRYWVGHFLGGNRMNITDMPDHQIEYMILLMNKHDFYYEEGGKTSYGFFSLDKGSFDNAVRVARDNTMDHELTYDIEFNEFISKSIM